ncbi:protein NYNRIN-like [Gossypium australe]|uniref:Protein NYNRIN-like n=1 Tax=Gossypium australe TaxID=47621 RepID=A0A5B6W632_9ROSI|nr:protein NYNRIN-like [Gossypium australe]
MWGMDVIRPISSEAYGQHRFIFVEVGYFTRMVKVASYANITKSIVIRTKREKERKNTEKKTKKRKESKRSHLTAQCREFVVPHRSAVKAAKKKNKRSKRPRLVKIGIQKLLFTLYAYQTLVRIVTGQHISHWFHLLKLKFLLSELKSDEAE